MLKVFVNPYCHLDGQGRLAGACPEAEPMRRGGPPLNRLVGATRQETPGSYRVTDTDPRLGPTGKSDIFYVFSDKPVEVNDAGVLGHFYLARFASKELFAMPKSGEAPLDKLADARDKAIADFAAMTGEPPDQSTWPAQFSLDPVVKAHCESRQKPANEEPTKKSAKPGKD